MILWLLSKPIPSPGASPGSGGHDMVENFKSIAPILCVVLFVCALIFAASTSSRGPSK